MFYCAMDYSTTTKKSHRGQHETTKKYTNQHDQLDATSKRRLQHQDGIQYELLELQRPEYRRVITNKSNI
jgi:hypothetical protein